MNSAVQRCGILIFFIAHTTEHFVGSSCIRLTGDVRESGVTEDGERS